MQLGAAVGCDQPPADRRPTHWPHQYRTRWLRPDGKTLASGSADQSVRLWDVATHRQVGPPLTGHTDAVNSVAFSPDGKTLASGSADDTVRLWDVAITGRSAPLTGHTEAVYSVAFSSPDGKILASGTDDGPCCGRWPATARSAPLSPATPMRSNQWRSVPMGRRWPAAVRTIQSSCGM